MSVFKTKIVNRVIDSLDVRSFRHAFPTELLQRLAKRWRLLIENYEPGSPLQYEELPGLGTFQIWMSGHRPYEFKLRNPQIAEIRIWNVDRWSGKAVSQTGQMYVSFRSVFLQKHGLEGARRVLNKLTELFCQPIKASFGTGPEFDRISRVDLAVDTQEKRDMRWADLDRFVCRARKVDTWAELTPDHVEQRLKIDLSEGNYLPQDRPDADEALPALARSASRVLHGYIHSVLNDLSTYGQASLSRVVSENRVPHTVYFGRFGSQLYARRYNKLGSLVVHNKLYMLDVWLKNNWDGESPVWRTEFSLSGDFLKDYCLILNGEVIEDCRDLHMLEHVLPVIWDYLVKDWLRMTDKVEDSNVWRRPVAEEWEILEGAFGNSVLAGKRDHSRAVPRDCKHLVDQVVGCSVSTVALRSVELESFDAALERVVDDFVARVTDDCFRVKVNERLREFGLDVFTDTALSALFRSEMLYVGLGS
jgi:hypothetical protein